MRSGQRARRSRQFLRPHVVGRRVDQIAGQKQTSRRCAKSPRHPRLGQHQLGRGRASFLVTVEDIAAQQPGQRGIGAAAEIRHLAQAVDAIGQLFGRQRQRNGSLPLPSPSAQARIAPLALGKGISWPSRGGKAGRQKPLCLSLASHARTSRRGDSVQGNGGPGAMQSSACILNLTLPPSNSRNGADVCARRPPWRVHPDCRHPSIGRAGVCGPYMALMATGAPLTRWRSACADERPPPASRSSNIRPRARCRC